MSARRPPNEQDTKAALVPAAKDGNCLLCRFFRSTTAGDYCRRHYATSSMGVGTVCGDFQFDAERLALSLAFKAFKATRLPETEE